MNRFAFLIVALLPCALAACKPHASPDASQPLTQSFQKAEPATRQNIDVATAQLKAGHYTEAARSLASVVSQPNLSREQKQAIGIALQQLNQAIAKDPALDTKEMYELRRSLFRAVDGGARF